MESRFGFQRGRPMAGLSRVEWTDVIWNPIMGRTRISPGCDHCYAARFAERFRSVVGHTYVQGFDLKIHERRMEDQQG